MGKGKLLSCLTDCAYISDFPEDSPPARPVSQLQLDQRQRQLLRQRHARERGVWTGYTHESGNQNESESVGRHSGQGAQGRGVRRQGGEGVDLEEGNEEDDILPQRRRRQGVEYELDEYLHEDGDGVAYESENRAAHSRNHAEELLFQRRQSAHSELPRRHQTLPSRFAPEYDHEIRGHERGARRGARDGGVRRGHGGSEDAPPRYEDHVFDRVVDDDDNNDDA